MSKRKRNERRKEIHLRKDQNWWQHVCDTQGSCRSTHRAWTSKQDIQHQTELSWPSFQRLRLRWKNYHLPIGTLARVKEADIASISLRSKKNVQHFLWTFLKWFTWKMKFRKERKQKKNDAQQQRQQQDRVSTLESASKVGKWFANQNWWRANIR